MWQGVPCGSCASGLLCYWEKLSKGGDPKAQQCGWLKDKYGVSWQIVPSILPDLVKDPDSAKSQRAMTAMLQMKKLDIDALKRAYAG
jgi:predicted 3-demethylubiquinone-9 3-methyltransferase (glyoxalase superfamily)